jgi:hypothetical protein
MNTASLINIFIKIMEKLIANAFPVMKVIFNKSLGISENVQNDVYEIKLKGPNMSLNNEQFVIVTIES